MPLLPSPLLLRSTDAGARETNTILRAVRKEGMRKMKTMTWKRKRGSAGGEGTEPSLRFWEDMKGIPNDMDASRLENPLSIFLAV